jgi:hypothetical protein
VAGLWPDVIGYLQSMTLLLVLVAWVLLCADVSVLLVRAVDD